MKNNNLTTKLSTVATLVALSIGANNAFAATGDTVTADATIYNEVTVSYKAVGDTGAARTAKDDVSVVVSIVEAPVAITKTTTNTTTASGTLSNDYTIDAQANGDDTYVVTASATPDDAAELTPIGTSLILLDSAGVVQGPLPASVELGSGIALSGSATGVIEFPGGSLDGFDVGDYVVIDGTVYEVSATTTGNAESDGVAEVLDTLTLTLVGGAVADLSAVVSAGDVIGERLFVRLETTATNTDPDSPQDATIDLTVTSTDEDGDNTNDSATTSGTTDSVTGSFQNTELGIDKKVSTDGTNYYDTGDASIGRIVPGSTLYYQVVVEPQLNSADATLTEVNDTMPEYTTFVPSSISVSFVDATGTKTVAVTDAAGNVEEAGYVAGEFGSNTMTIYLGDGVTASAGGTVKYADVVTITYQVIVD